MPTNEPSAAAIMARDPLTVDAGQSLDDAMEVMDRHAIRHLPVLSGGRLVGVLTDREVLGATGWLPKRVHESRGPSETSGHPRRVEEVMRARVATVEPSTSLPDLMHRLLHGEQGCLAVVEDAALVGIVTETDLLRTYVEERAGPRGSGLEDPTAEAIMTVNPVTVGCDTSLGEAWRLCSEHNLHHLPVIEAGLLVGILSDRDLRRARGQGRHADLTVDEIMTRKVLSGPRSMRASEVARILLENRISALSIAERGELRGIVTISDILRHGLETQDSRPS